MGFLLKPMQNLYFFEKHDRSASDFWKFQSSEFFSKNFSARQYRAIDASRLVFFDKNRGIFLQNEPEN